MFKTRCGLRLILLALSLISTESVAVGQVNVADLTVALKGKTFVPSVSVGYSAMVNGINSEFPVKTLIYPDGHEWFRVESGITHADAVSYKPFNGGIEFSVTGVEVKDDWIELKMKASSGSTAFVRLMFGAAWRSRMTNAMVIESIDTFLNPKVAQKQAAAPATPAPKGISGAANTHGTVVSSSGAVMYKPLAHPAPDQAVASSQSAAVRPAAALEPPLPKTLLYIQCEAVPKPGAILYSDPELKERVGEVDDRRATLERFGVWDLHVGVSRVFGTSMYGGSFPDGAAMRSRWFAAADDQASGCITLARTILLPEVAPSNKDDFAGVHIGDRLEDALAVLQKAGYRVEGMDDAAVPVTKELDAGDRKLTLYSLPYNSDQDGDESHPGIYTGGGLQMNRVDADGRDYDIIFGSSITPVTDPKTFLHESRVFSISAKIKDKADVHNYSDLLEAAQKRYPNAETRNTLLSPRLGTTITPAGGTLGLIIQIRDMDYARNLAYKTYNEIFSKTPAAGKPDF